MAGRLSAIAADPQRWARLNVGPRKQPQAEMPRPTVTWLDIVKMAGNALKTDTSGLETPGGMMAAAADPGALRATDTLPMPDAATFATNFLPGAGDLKGLIEDAPAVYEAGRAAWDDPSASNLMAAGGTAALAGLGALPFLPGGMTKGVGKVADAIGDAGDTRKGIRAYHGSPHDFDKFDISKIGTGEGVQAYGHGLYFAEAPSVANSYRGSVSAQKGASSTIDGRAINWDDPREYAAFELWRHDGDAEAAAEFAERTFNNKAASELLRSGEKLPEVKPPGRMYEVNINADPADFLDWDKPLSEQSEKVRKLVEQEPWASALHPFSDKNKNYFAYLNNPNRAIPGDDFDRIKKHEPTGRDIVRGVSPFALTSNNEDAFRKGFIEDQLRQAGIPGIKYLDQGSRAAGEGSRNFVVFDDAIVDILRKYGLAGLLAGMGAFGAASIPTSQAEASEAR